MHQKGKSGDLRVAPVTGASRARSTIVVSQYSSERNSVHMNLDDNWLDSRAPLHSVQSTKKSPSELG
jgi:hypothetical protein